MRRLRRGGEARVGLVPVPLMAVGHLARAADGLGDDWRSAATEAGSGRGGRGGQGAEVTLGIQEGAGAGLALDDRATGGRRRAARRQTEHGRPGQRVVVVNQPAKGEEHYKRGVRQDLRK